MAVSRGDVEAKWRGVVDGVADLEAVGRWALGVTSTDEPIADVPTEAALQRLIVLALRQEGARMDPESTLRQVRDALENWRLGATRYDEDPYGSVYLSEDIEMDPEGQQYVTRWTGMFSGSWQGTSGLDVYMPQSLDADSAIAWGRARSPRVFIRPRDGVLYSAGDETPSDTTEWIDEMDLSPRDDRIAGKDWLYRTENDEEISWDVAIWPNLQDIPETHQALEAFRESLRGSPEVEFVELEEYRDDQFPTAVIRVLARTEAQAKRAAAEFVRPGFAAAAHVVARPFGWTMGLNAVPSGTPTDWTRDHDGWVTR